MLIIVELLLVVILAFVAVGLIQLYWVSPIGVVGSSMTPTIKGGSADGSTKGAKVYINKSYKEIKKGDVVVVYIPDKLGMTKSDKTRYMLADYLAEVGDDTQLCPASKKTTFSDFIRSMPFVSSLQAGEDMDTGDNGYKRVIKRIVGCPGDQIDFVDGVLYVNGKPEDTFVYTWTQIGVTQHQSGIVDAVSYDKNWSYKLGADEYFILGDNRGNSNDSEDYGPIKGSWIYGKVFLLAQDGKLTRNF